MADGWEGGLARGGARGKGLLLGRVLDVRDGIAVVQAEEVLLARVVDGICKQRNSQVSSRLESMANRHCQSVHDIATAGTTLTSVGVNPVRCIKQSRSASR